MGTNNVFIPSGVDGETLQIFFPPERADVVKATLNNGNVLIECNLFDKMYFPLVSPTYNFDWSQSATIPIDPDFVNLFHVKFLGEASSASCWLFVIFYDEKGMQLKENLLKVELGKEATMLISSSMRYYRSFVRLKGQGEVVIRGIDYKLNLTKGSVAGFIRNSKAIFVIFDPCGSNVYTANFDSGSVLLSISNSTDMSIVKQIERFHKYITFDSVRFFECDIPSSATTCHSISSDLQSQVNRLGWLYPFALDVFQTGDLASFQRKFTFAKGRHADKETVRYIAYKNIIKYSGSSNLEEIFINSSVIYCYKSLELGPLYVNSEIIDYLEIAHNKAIPIPQKNGVRNDGVQLSLSVIMATIHYYALHNDFHNCVVKLVHDTISLTSNSVLKTYYSVNISKILAFGVIFSVLFKNTSDVKYFIDYMHFYYHKIPVIDLGEKETVWAEEFNYFRKIIEICDNFCIASIPRKQVIELACEASRIKEDWYLSSLVGQIDHYFDNMSKMKMDDF